MGIKTEHSDWLINKGSYTEPIRLEQLTGQTKQNGGRCRMTWREKKNILIHVKFDQYNENNKYINQSTSNWTFGRHKRILAKLLTNRGFSYATVRNEERLQP